MNGKTVKRLPNPTLRALAVMFLLVAVAVSGCHGRSPAVVTDQDETIVPGTNVQEKKGGTPPSVVSVNPPNNWLSVSVSTIVSATFSVDMDPATINDQSFVLAEESGAPVSGSVAYAPDIVTAKFTPAASLKDKTVYIATVKAQVKSASGTAMAADYTWRFTTGDILLTAFPDKMSHTDIAAFEFKSDAKKFECKLDADPFLPCTSPKDLNGLLAGKHTFSVRGLDAGGKPATNPAVYEWDIFAQLAGGYMHECAIQIDRKLYCWGQNDKGQVGDGNAPNIRTTPVQIGNERWIMVGAGLMHTCAVNSAGQMFCWGLNDKGQQGNGNKMDNNRPAPVVAGKDDKWVSISLGSDHTCGIKSGGKLFCWGGNSLRQLGNGNNSEQIVPVEVSGNGTWATVTAGSHHTCAIKSDGHLYCWGTSLWGELGDGDGNSHNQAAPMAIGSDTWRAITAGADHSCGIKADGRLYCWGYNEKGQIGDGSPVDANAFAASPVVIGGDQWIDVRSEYYHTCAIKSDRGLYCWGDNFAGNLGDGTKDTRNVPVPIGKGSWYDVTPSFYHTCGITGENKISCWGSNANNQFGIVGIMELLAPGKATDLP